MKKTVSKEMTGIAIAYIAYLCISKGVMTCQDSFLILPRLLWTILWTIFPALFLSRNHIKTLRRKGAVTFSIGHFLFALFLFVILLIFPELIPNYESIAITFFLIWISLIYGIEKAEDLDKEAKRL